MKKRKRKKKKKKEIINLSFFFLKLSVFPSAGLWFANLGTLDSLSLTAQLTVAPVSSCGIISLLFFR
jgi:hypothetical protein